MAVPPQEWDCKARNPGHRASVWFCKPISSPCSIDQLSLLIHNLLQTLACFTDSGPVLNDLFTYVYTCQNFIVQILKKEPNQLRWVCENISYKLGYLIPFLQHGLRVEYNFKYDGIESWACLGLPSPSRFILSILPTSVSCVQIASISHLVRLSTRTMVLSLSMQLLLTAQHFLSAFFPYNWTF